MRDYCRLRRSLLLWAGLHACQSPPKSPVETAVPAVAQSSSNVAAAPVSTPNSVRQLAPLIPVGYELLAAANGDLNRDTVPDKTLVLQTVGADTIARGDTLNRPYCC
jgi:hypothetical protein